MADCGPQLKKYKTAEESVFDGYWDDYNAVERLKKTLELLTTRDYCFCLLKITKCNADKGNAFSQAFCETSTNSKDTSAGAKSIDAYRFSTVFNRGYEMVMDYTNDRNNVPVKRRDRIALERLLTVLMNLKGVEEAVRNAQSKEEVDWTITLAHHLLRKLAVNQTYVVDKRRHGRTCICMCCQDTIMGSYGDTSIGNSTVWHGYLDLILGSEVPISVLEDDNQETCEGNKSSFEIHRSSEFPAKHRDRLIAQTIVFSFLQKKEKSTYENYLIPSIGIAKNHFVLFLYDSEHDILLESKVIKLWSASGHIITSAVLALWLAINFSFTCSGVTEHMKSCGFTADFPEHVGKELEIYQKNLSFNCGPGSEGKEMFEPEIYDIFNLH